MLTQVTADADAFWLNATNIGLGAVVLISLAAVALGVVRDLVQRRRERIRLSRELDRDLKALVAEYQADPHIFNDPALGATMADGGTDHTPRKERP